MENKKKKKKTKINKKSTKETKRVNTFSEELCKNSPEYKYKEVEKINKDLTKLNSMLMESVSIAIDSLRFYSNQKNSRLQIAVTQDGGVNARTAINKIISLRTDGDSGNE